MLGNIHGSDPTATPESVSTRTNVGTLALTTDWTQIPVTFTIPSVAGNSIGNVGAQTNDDALYIQRKCP